MRSKTKKSVSRLVGIWTFLLIFIFKGIFPKPAYAFLSSLDACAANPECAAAVSSEVAPAVSAPTGAGFGASTLSTTTAAGATTSSVQGVAEISVAARLGTLGILYYWNQSQNEKAQNKAKQKYCAANPSDSVCGFAWNVTGQGLASGMPSCELSGVFYPRTLYATSISFSSSTFTDSEFYGYYQGCPKDIVVLDDQPSPENFFAGTATITKISDPPPWKDWSQEKRDEAVRLLNPSDWQGLITSMPEAGRLNPGDKINAPIIVIPGEETDDPNTPADERLLRKEDGFFTFPGLPDFDKDGTPDTSDSDDDNDGTPDTSDPQPHNPNVPTASGGSSNPGDSGEEVTPEVLQDIRDIINSYKPDENLKCVECADEIEAYLKEQGIHGRRVKLDTTRQVREDDFIMDDSLPASSDAIATNGHHEGIGIRINGEEIVFDNHHPDGVPAQQWMNNLTFYSKEYSGASFRESGYLF